MSSFKQRKTPGVYITELNAFPASIVGVQTAIPAFIGYTEKAELSGKPIYYKPVVINSLADYEAVFGAGFKPVYKIVPEVGSPPGSPPPPDSWDFEVLGTPFSSPPTQNAYYRLDQTSKSHFYLYNSMRLFYDNGGGTCYVVSVGDYTNQGSTPEGVLIDRQKLEKGLDAIADQSGPTMLVVPDATLLETNDEFQKLVRSMLAQCSDLQDRVGILDVYGTQSLNQNDPGPAFQAELDAVIAQFQNNVGEDNLSYGMGYFPFLVTSVVERSEIYYTNFDIGSPHQLALLQDDVLGVEASRLYHDNPGQLDTVNAYIAMINPNASPPLSPDGVVKLNQNLSNALPILKQMENIIAAKLNMLPPSGGMAGVYALVDRTSGVWNAPANVVMNSVVSPSVRLDDAQQGNLNVPLSGKAVNVIRQFTGRGPVVWGARTLDGNSNDWRYIQVRRTIVYIEQSIKNSLNQFVFAANDGNTWVTVTAQVSNFLQGLWSQGGLMGATASEAFTVQCGLGSTMTPQDILDGYMIVQVTLQMIRPAEFIELTFKQQMQGA